MTDPVYARTILLLVRVYTGSGPFLLGRLAGRGERETARTLVELARQGLAVQGGEERWTLTEAGRAALNPTPSVRPGSVPRRFKLNTGKTRHA
jgi:hypothetical protein